MQKSNTDQTVHELAHINRFVDIHAKWTIKMPQHRISRSIPKKIRFVAWNDCFEGYPKRPKKIIWKFY